MPTEFSVLAPVIKQEGLLPKITKIVGQRPQGISMSAQKKANSIVELAFTKYYKLRCSIETATVRS